MTVSQYSEMLWCKNEAFFYQGTMLIYCSIEQSFWKKGKRGYSSGKGLKMDQPQGEVNARSGISPILKERLFTSLAFKYSQLHKTYNHSMKSLMKLDPHMYYGFKGLFLIR